MWTSKYLKLYKKIGLPDPAVDIFARKIPLLSGVWEAPGDVWGFPPALLPLWTDGSLFSYQGYWKHWFCERKLTIVELRAEGGLHAIEIARNFDQLASLLVLYGVVAADGVDNEVESFCASVGVDDPHLIDKLSVDVGDVPEALKALPEYAGNLPSRLLDRGDNYTGDFPVEGRIEGNLRSYCLTEFPPERRGDLKSKALVPNWLLLGSKKNVFDECFRQGDMLGAWMSVNSNGWDVSDLRSAMAMLADFSSDDLFKELADAWLLASDVEFVPY